MTETPDWKFTFPNTSGRTSYVIPYYDGTRIIGTPICPDLLDYAALGAADNLRGRVVRAFFWVMRAWR